MLARLAGADAECGRSSPRPAGRRATTAWGASRGGGDRRRGRAARRGGAGRTRPGRPWPRRGPRPKGPRKTRDGRPRAAARGELADQRMPVLVSRIVETIWRLRSEDFMSAGWVAGSVRARGLARRRMGAEATRRLAACPSLSDALQLLAATGYGANIGRGQELAAAQHEVADTLLWDLRVLAGWLPSDGARLLRTLGAWFELANVDELLQSIAGRRPAPSSGLACSPPPGPGSGRRRPTPSCGPRSPPRPGRIRAARPRGRCAWACAHAGRSRSPRSAIRPGSGPRARPRCWWRANGSRPAGDVDPAVMGGALGLLGSAAGQAATLGELAAACRRRPGGCSPGSALRPTCGGRRRP